MNTSIPPTRRPGATQLYKLLAGDPATDTALTKIITQLGLDETASLSGLVRNAAMESRATGFADGKVYVLREVAKVLLAEPSGIDAERLALLRAWAES